ncbi:MAG: hypothetical protein UY07_C0006G0036 [Parcubacteria group bacterium GW2011_GWA1_47_8]|nr:MAG: hypothetical protein UY07_C0006G0036 [Parcubacteria group bacterium GW2011_GWA1_47_8]
MSSDKFILITHSKNSDDDGGADIHQENDVDSMKTMSDHGVVLEKGSGEAINLIEPNETMAEESIEVFKQELFDRGGIEIMQGGSDKDRLL